MLAFEPSSIGALSSLLPTRDSIAGMIVEYARGGAGTSKSNNLPAGHPTNLRVPDVSVGGDPTMPEHLRSYLKLPKNKKKLMAIDDKFHFALKLSDSLPSNRTMPDLRPESCQRIPAYTKAELDRMPRTSVIFAQVDEPESTMRRSVASVINHSPPELLEEVIIVDDGSEWPVAPSITALSPKVKVLALGEREGLIRARLRGFAIAKAPTVTFLDSHIECNPGWLEPLLSRLAAHRALVISPQVDMIDPVTLEHQTTYAQRGGFFLDGSLTFNWYNPWDEQHRLKAEKVAAANGDPASSTPGIPKDAESMLTPAIAGGLFSMWKSHFEHIGTYDTGMEVWGSENIEFSVRTWSCGGAMEIHPCSHVGHIFRVKSPPRPEAKRHSTLDYTPLNRARTTFVWFDEYSRYTDGNWAPVPNADPAHPKFQPNYTVAGDAASLQSRHALRKSLACKPFEWYLQNVFSDHDLSEEMANSTSEGFNDRCSRFDHFCGPPWAGIPRPTDEANPTSGALKRLCSSCALFRAAEDEAKKKALAKPKPAKVKSQK